ncbi:YraN family protein [Heliorestis convoluta]|uniref:YraN family protein n=1 Tax=Heliorestis convoluta TaxID=356322 RepID=A0A5Q2N6G7_9FIRM|nr:YraN family protein [Heliorestis convoluta]
MEVRTRSTTRWGRGEETIDYRKQRRLLRVASFFLQEKRPSFGHPRFDLVTIHKLGWQNKEHGSFEKSSYEIDHRIAIITP